MQGWLSTHILDTSSGLPAGNVKLLLSILKAGRQEQLVETYTNRDGRTDTPLLEGEKFVCGIYEISFYIGDYFGMRNSQPTNNPFLNVVPVRFGIEDASKHYHVPLLVSPYGYSTYRGS